MKYLKRLFPAFLAAVMACSLCACGSSGGKTESSASGGPASDDTSNKKISVVCTNFPEYDFVRQIAGDAVKLTMLLKPGAESHSYEPTPQDIIKIQHSNLFIYVGGDSDAWVDKILSSMDQSNMKVFKLMDCVDLVEEELSEGMQAESTKEESSPNTPEMDEHVWTSPANAMKIVQKLSDTLCKLDPSNKNTYKKRTKTYLAKLKTLDNDFWKVVNNASRKEIVVGDRFPFRYFCKEYGLTYYAAFPGCSTDTEANPSTVSFLIKKVKSDKIPVVFHIELSNGQMCKSICEATGAKSELLNAIHNVSDSDFKAGATYIDLMQHNVKVLKEALN